MVDNVEEILRKVAEVDRRSIAEAERRLQEQEKANKERILKNLEDPLRNPVERVPDREFLPNGRPDMTTVTRVIARWKDSEGHTLYTRGVRGGWVATRQNTCLTR